MRFTLLILISFVWISCTNNNKLVVLHPEGYYKEVYYVKDDSVKHGLYQKFYANDVLADSCHYNNDLIHGKRSLFDENGQLEIRESYVNGVFDGPYTTYYPNGQLKKIQHYVQDVITGEVREFYPDGKVKAITHFVNNLENGPFQEFYENGNLHWEGFYKGGDFEQDTLREFNAEGILIRKLFCENGICQTAWTPEKGYIEVKKYFQN